MDIDINGKKHVSAVEIMHKLQAENIAENTPESDVKISENIAENIAENIPENTPENDHGDQIYHEKFSRISYLCACSIL